MVPVACCSCLRFLSTMICAKRALPELVCCRKVLSMSMPAAPASALYVNSQNESTNRIRKFSRYGRLLFGPGSRRQHFAVAVRLHCRHHAGAFHLLDQPRRAIVADAQMALHERNRGAPRLEHDLNRLIVERIGL